MRAYCAGASSGSAKQRWAATLLFGLATSAFPYANAFVGHQSGAQVNTYGPNWTYPNKVVPLDVIGTDRTHHESYSARFIDHYNKSWFGQEVDEGADLPRQIVALQEGRIDAFVEGGIGDAIAG